MSYSAAYEVLRVAAITCWFVYQVGLLFSGAVVALKAYGREWSSVGEVAPVVMVSFLFYCVAYVRASSYDGATPVPEIAAISLCYLGLGILSFVVAWRVYRRGD